MSNSISWAIGGSKSSVHLCIFLCVLMKSYSGKGSVFWPVFLWGWLYSFLCLLALCSPAASLLQLLFSSTGYSSSSLQFFHNTAVYGIFEGMESSLFSLVFLCWAAIKMNNLEWIYGKIYAWAGWSLSTSTLLNQPLRQQSIWLVCIFK